MMRVEVNMDEPFRGVIAKYAKKNNLSMPSAYAELLEKSVMLSDVELSGIQLQVDEDDFDPDEIAKHFDSLTVEDSTDTE
jgi:hypothetical protein